MESTAEVTAGDVARLAGVGRAAVSNWRRRHADFPKPVGGTTASPTFRLADVERWLTANDRMPPQSGGERLWLALQHHYADPDREVPALIHSLVQAGGRAAERPPAAVSKVVKEMGIGAALSALVDRFVDLRGRRVSVATSPQVADLIAELVSPAGKTVLDPACRSGALLAAVAAGGADVVLGQDVDADNVTVAHARLFEALGRVDLRQGGLADDAFADALVDAVVCDPPAGGNWGYDLLATDLRWEYSLPPRSEAELAWVQHALARCKPGGVAMLLLPPGVAERTAGRRIRRELLRRGAVRAVIALPSGATAPHNMRVHLWVLRRPDGRHAAREVLMVDADGPWEEAAVVVKAAMTAHDKGRALPDRLRSRARIVEAVSLSSEDVDLTPSRQVSGGQVQVAFEVIVNRRDELARMLAGLPELVPPLVRGEGEIQAAEVAVGELAKSGLVSIHANPDMPLRAGDVLVPSVGPRPRITVVAGADKGVLGPQRLLVRVDPEHLDPWFLAGFLGLTANLRRVTSMGSVPRIDVRKAQLPRLVMEAQRAYGVWFRKLRELDDILRSAQTTGEEFTAMVAEGLASGTLSSGA